MNTHHRTRTKRCPSASRPAACGLGALLQVDRVPIRIQTDAFDQTRTYWVCNDISGNRFQVFVAANGPIMKSASPDRAAGTVRDVCSVRGTGFQRFDRFFQRFVFAKLQQPMRVIRHQNPSKHRGICQQSAVFEPTTRRKGGSAVKEHGFSVGRRRGQVIDLIGDAETPFAQCSMAGKRHAVQCGIGRISRQSENTLTLDRSAPQGRDRQGVMAGIGRAHRAPRPAASVRSYR